MTWHAIRYITFRLVGSFPHSTRPTASSIRLWENALRCLGCRSAAFSLSLKDERMRNRPPQKRNMRMRLSRSCIVGKPTNFLALALNQGVDVWNIFYPTFFDSTSWVWYLTNHRQFARHTICLRHGLVAIYALPSIALMLLCPSWAKLSTWKW